MAHYCHKLHLWVKKFYFPIWSKSWSTRAQSGIPACISGFWPLGGQILAKNSHFLSMWCRSMAKKEHFRQPRVKNFSFPSRLKSPSTSVQSRIGADLSDFGDMSVQRYAKNDHFERFWHKMAHKSHFWELRVKIFFFQRGSRVTLPECKMRLALACLGSEK